MTVRIAFFAPLLATGGTQRHLQQVLALLDRERFAAEVLTLRPGGEVEDELRASGVRVSSLSLGGLATPRSVGVMVRAARELRASGVQVVHGYQWRPALVGAIIGRLAGVPLVVASKRSLTGEDTQARLAWRLLGRSVDTIVVNAEALRVEGEAHGVRARWALVRNGVDLERFGSTPPREEARAQLGLDPRRPVIGTVGRLEERKDHEHLLHVARAVLARANGMRPQVLVVGDGPLRARLAEQAATLGMGENVVFTGSLADVRVPLAAMDVFVLPSRAEGLSNALLEAMAAGRPVVATAVGGTSEVVDPDRTGVLVPPGDVDAMASAILALLGDAARARRIGGAAQRWVGDEFDARASVARLEHLYDARLAARRLRVAA
jgi:glycosyltransferase involved in cell wall biosynthesis